MSKKFNRLLYNLESAAILTAYSVYGAARIIMDIPGAIVNAWVPDNTYDKIQSSDEHRFRSWEKKIGTVWREIGTSEEWSVTAVTRLFNTEPVATLVNGNKKIYVSCDELDKNYAFFQVDKSHERVAASH